MFCIVLSFPPGVWVWDFKFGCTISVPSILSLNKMQSVGDIDLARRFFGPVFHFVRPDLIGRADLILYI